MGIRIQPVVLNDSRKTQNFCVKVCENLLSDFMKRCPRCDQNYLDDTLNFCLTDGTQLIPDNVEATVVMERPTVTAAVRGKNGLDYGSGSYCCYC